MAKSALGKGLGALMGARPTASLPEVPPGDNVHRVDLHTVSPSPLQPRKEFAADALQELVDSIREHGIIQPLIVRQMDGRYELIAGERRWRAAQELGLSHVPVIIRSANDLEVLEISLIENLQRADLSPIEEAQGYARLAEEFKLRQEDIATKVGRSRAAVANAMRLLDLHPQIQMWLSQNLVSVGHAKVLLGLKAHEDQLFVAETILRRSATVRQTERLVARQMGTTRPRRKKNDASAGASSATITALEERLQKHLGTRVTLRHSEKQGRIEIDYYGNDDLQRIMGAMGLPGES
jgi:ParB family chromosome partitioning protein